MASPPAAARSPWADSALLHHDPRSYRASEPLSARIIGILFTLFTAGVCAALFSHRVASIKSWTRLPYIRWLVLLQYAGAFLYTVFSSVIRYGLNPDDDAAVCNASAVVCIMLYAIMKGLLYLFLADRLHVVRSSTKSRKHSKLFLFHTIGIGMCIVVLTIIFVYLRLHYLDGDVCVIGVQRVMMIIGVTFDALINIYLTAFFLYYLSKSFNLQPFRNWRGSGMQSLESNDRAQPLRTEINKLTQRTTIGLAITLLATITNLATMTIMNGEVLWLCFLTCKADILLCVLVLHYMSTGSGRHRHRPHVPSNAPSIKAPSARIEKPPSLAGADPYLPDISPPLAPVGGVDDRTTTAAGRGNSTAKGFSPLHGPLPADTGARDRICDAV